MQTEGGGDCGGGGGGWVTKLTDWLTDGTGNLYSERRVICDLCRDSKSWAFVHKFNSSLGPCSSCVTFVSPLGLTSASDSQIIKKGLGVRWLNRQAIIMRPQFTRGRHIHWPPKLAVRPPSYHVRCLVIRDTRDNRLSIVCQSQSTFNLFALTAQPWVTTLVHS